MKNTTPSNPSEQTQTEDSWFNRIKLASAFLNKTTQEITAILKQFGIEEFPAGLEMLSDEEVTPFGDMRKIFCDDNNIPVPKLRMAMKYLRGPKTSQKTDSIDPDFLALQNRYGIKTRLSDIESTELIEFYKFDKPSHPVTVELKKRFGDKKVIVFNPDSNTVNIEETANYIADLDQGYPEEENTLVDGIIVKLYAIGEIPNQTIDEDPLFANKPLKRGRSIINRINWLDIDTETKQFCRLIAENNEIDVNDKFAIRNLVEVLSTKNPLKELAKLYPEVDMEFREAKRLGKLPSLIISLNNIKNDGNKNNNPFNINRKY